MAHALSAGNVCSSRVDEAPAPPGPPGLLSLADDPIFVAALDDLDRGVFEHGADARKVAPRSPLIAQLVVPGAQTIERRHSMKLRRGRVSTSRAGISAWAACWI